MPVSSCAAATEFSDSVTLFNIALLIATGFLAGASNALVGGGTLFSFPILIAVGMAPVTAVTTNMTALWPGLITSAYAYREELRRAREGMPARIAVAFAGGLTGAILLLLSGDALFSKLVPWLLAAGTFLFTFAKPLVRHVVRASPDKRALGPLVVMEFFCAIYGSYFTAGIGILLLAAMALAGEHNMQSANAQRNFLVCFITGTAIIIYVAMGKVDWFVAPILMVGSITGGYIGARIAKYIPGEWLRRLITLAGATFAVAAFVKVYG
jgi:uncharacterized membrane protein YfcA